MLKKTVSLLCAAALSLCCSFGAFADDSRQSDTESTRSDVSWFNEWYDEGYSDLPVKRISGDNRYQTASECVFRTSFVNDARSVILASGTSWADALVGVPLSKKLNAPILLTGKDELNSDTKYAMSFIFTENVYVLGGEGVISGGIETKLKEGDKQEEEGYGQNSYNVQRYAGNDRFGTAVEIAKQLQKDEETFPETVFFVSTSTFADALSVSTVAALKESPILYVRPSGKLDDLTKEYLESCKQSIKKAYIIGGEKAISNNVFKELEPYVAKPTDKKTKNIERISGSNRYETCLKINDAFKDLFKKDLCIATGKNFPDALAGGAVAAKEEAPMLLVADSLNDAQKKYLTKRDTENFFIFGGYNAVNYSVEKQAVFIEDPKLDLSLSGNNAVLKWNNPPKVKGFELIRDGKTIKTMSDAKTLSYTDKNLDFSKDHSYTLRFKLDDKHYAEKTKNTSDPGVLLNSVKLKPRYSYPLINTQGSKNIVTTQTLTQLDLKLLKQFADKHFTKDMTNADKVSYTLNWINKNVTYAKGGEALKTLYSLAAHGTYTPVNAVFGHKVGQCDCYNGALIGMMCYLGYDAQMILGYRGTPDEKGNVASKWQHFWGEVKINGQIYLMEAGNYGEDGGWCYLCARYGYDGRYIKNGKFVK